MAANSPIDPRGDDPTDEFRAHQKMVNAEPGVASEGIPIILPEGVDPLVRMQMGDEIVLIAASRSSTPYAPVRHQRPWARLS